MSKPISKYHKENLGGNFGRIGTKKQAPSPEACQLLNHGRLAQMFTKIFCKLEH